MPTSEWIEPPVEVDEAETMEVITDQIEKAKIEKDFDSVRVLRLKERLLLLKEISILKQKQRPSTQGNQASSPPEAYKSVPALISKNHILNRELSVVPEAEFTSYPSTIGRESEKGNESFLRIHVKKNKSATNITEN